MAIVTTPQYSFKYRMGAGFPGDVNRTHPASIEPVYNDASNPVLQAGLACLINSAGTGVRGMASGDTGVTTIWGVSVRIYPYQDIGTAGNAYGYQLVGQESLLSASTIDVLRWGYINVPINGAVVKGGAVYVWVAASSGNHIQGGFEAGASGGNTAAITNAVFNGANDGIVAANVGYGEIEVRQA